MSAWKAIPVDTVLRHVLMTAPITSKNVWTEFACAKEDLKDLIVLNLVLINPAYVIQLNVWLTTTVMKGSANIKQTLT